MRNPNLASNSYRLQASSVSSTNKLPPPMRAVLSTIFEPAGPSAVRVCVFLGHPSTRLLQNRVCTSKGAQTFGRMHGGVQRFFLDWSSSCRRCCPVLLQLAQPVPAPAWCPACCCTAGFAGWKRLQSCCQRHSSGKTSQKTASHDRHPFTHHEQRVMSQRSQFILRACRSGPVTRELHHTHFSTSVASAIAPPAAPAKTARLCQQMSLEPKRLRTIA